MPTISSFLALALLIAAGGGVRAAESVPTGFVAERVVPGPFGGGGVAFAFLPDERIVVITRNGLVRLASAGGGVSALIYTIPDVMIASERGLLGVAVDPQWPLRPYMYFFFTHTSGQSHVLMMTAAGDLSHPASTNVTLSSPFLLLDDIPDASDTHNGGTLRFGPDGMLYVSLGDDEEPCEAQNVTSLQGVVLRLDLSSMPGAGAGPPPKTDITPSDNPLPGPDENEKLVYAWGFRNPFRFTIDPATGDVIVGDVGGDAWEEIDRLAWAGYAGDNCGWPQREGPDPNDPSDSCGVGSTFSDPIFAYPHEGPRPQSVIAGPRFWSVTGSDDSLPASYDGQIFYADFFSGSIYRIELDGNDWIVAAAVPGQPNELEWATGLGFVSDLQEGPGGGIWYTNMSFVVPNDPDEGIYRIRRSLPTDAPVASAPGAPRLTARPNPAESGAPVHLRWAAPRAGNVMIRIIDVTGRLVRLLSPGPGASGLAEWDGVSHSGRPAGPGVYFALLQSGEVPLASTKITLVR